MNNPLRICICGGGGLGHTLAGVLSSQDNVKVYMLTGHPKQWNSDIIVKDPKGYCFHGHISLISSDPALIIPISDIVIVCVPAYLVEAELIKIKPYLRTETIVGAIVGNSGFFIFAHNQLPSSTPLFAFQRVPYISRVVEYGKSADLLGYKDELLVAVENIADTNFFCQLFSKLLKTPTTLVESFYEVTLSNSNPILHTGRLYSMWKDWNGEPYKYNPLFYYDWTDETSQLEIEMDRELFVLIDKLGISTSHLRRLLDHYESTDAISLTNKIKNIPSYANILSPMCKVDDGWIPDISSRYFTEDFPYGLKIIHDLAHQNNVDCPMIDKVYNWGMNLIGEQNKTPK